MKKKVVILGAGFGGVFTYKALHRFVHRNEKVGLSLVDTKNYFLFTPLLHEVATGAQSPENIVEPIRKELGCCLDKFYQARALKVNLKKQIVMTDLGEIKYDYLVLALGSRSHYYDTLGAKEHTFCLKSLGDAMRLKKHLISQFEHAVHIKDVTERTKALTFVVSGGGPTGVELVSEMHDLLKKTFTRYYDKKKIIKKVKIIIVDRNQELLAHFPKEFRAKVFHVLKKYKIDIKLGVSVKEVGKDFIRLSNGEKIATKTVVWTAGVRPNNIEFDHDVAKERSGKLLVNDYLQLKSEENVFALGDLAYYRPDDTKPALPALGQVATKEAKIVARNIVNLIRGRDLVKVNYHHAGTLVSLGSWMAVGKIGTVFFHGHFAWWLWRTIYLSKMISWRKRLKIVVDWTIHLFVPRDISEF